MRPGSADHLAPQPAPTMLLGALFLVITCAQCREEVLEADLLGDEEECALRDHLLAVHPTTLQPETLGTLVRSCGIS